MVIRVLFHQMSPAMLETTTQAQSSTANEIKIIFRRKQMEISIFEDNSHVFYSANAIVSLVIKSLLRNKCKFSFVFAFMLCTYLKNKITKVNPPWSWLNVTYNRPFPNKLVSQIFIAVYVSRNYYIVSTITRRSPEQLNNWIVATKNYFVLILFRTK